MPQPRTRTPLVSRLAAALLAATALSAGTALGQYGQPGQSGKADPVEEFRHALQLERNIRNDDKAALEYRRKNLAEKAARVKSLSDLSRVLLLSEWQTDTVAGARPGTGFDWEVRLVESQVRQELTKR